MLVDAYEQVTQMRDESRHIDAVLRKRDAVRAFDDGDHLLDDAGHGVGGGQVAAGESGIHQMQGERHRLTAGQRATQIRVHRVDHRHAFGVFVSV